MTAPRLLLAAFLVTALTVLTGVATADVPRVPDPAPAPVGARPAVAAAAILRDWDHQRARAWAAGQPRALRSLYTDGSVAGLADEAMLRAWLQRGLRVQGLRMQVLSVRVRSRTADRIVLVVTDRLAGGVAAGRGVRVRLPRDEPSTRTVVLRRVAGEWRVAAVAGQRSPDRTTWSAVRSRKE